MAGRLRLLPESDISERARGQYCRVAHNCEFMVKVVGYPNYRENDLAGALGPGGGGALSTQRAFP